MFYIYLIFNTKNGKLYVGKTNDLHSRWTTHKKVARGGKLKYHEFSAIHFAINKHGVEKFEFLCHQTFDNEDNCYLAEIYWIDFYNTRNSKFGYNASPGGIGVGSGVNSANFGLKRSPETILKLRESHLGDKNQNTGKTFSLETRQKMSAWQKGTNLGEDHPRSVLTDDVVRNMKIDFANGLSKKEITAKYTDQGAKYNNVVSMLLGYTWNHIKIN